MTYLMQHRGGRYSLEDLETMEREAEIEANTENQLQQLMRAKNVRMAELYLKDWNMNILEESTMLDICNLAKV